MSKSIKRRQSNKTQELKELKEPEVLQEIATLDGSMEDISTKKISKRSPKKMKQDATDESPKTATPKKNNVSKKPKTPKKVNHSQVLTSYLTNLLKSQNIKIKEITNIVGKNTGIIDLTQFNPNEDDALLTGLITKLQNVKSSEMNECINAIFNGADIKISNDTTEEYKNAINNFINNDKIRIKLINMIFPHPERENNVAGIKHIYFQRVNKHIDIIVSKLDKLLSNQITKEQLLSALMKQSVDEIYAIHKAHFDKNSIEESLCNADDLKGIKDKDYKNAIKMHRNDLAVSENNINLFIQGFEKNPEKNVQECVREYSQKIAELNKFKNNRNTSDFVQYLVDTIKFTIVLFDKYEDSLKLIFSDVKFPISKKLRTTLKELVNTPKISQSELKDFHIQFDDLFSEKNLLDYKLFAKIGSYYNIENTTKNIEICYGLWTVIKLYTLITGAKIGNQKLQTMYLRL